MKRLHILATLLCISVGFTVQAQIAFQENFDPRTGYVGGIIPPGWTQQFDSNYENWLFMTGGHSSNPEDAASGTYNATFYVESHNNDHTKLITPVFDISYMKRPRLKFKLAMMSWWWGGIPYTDQLTVYYKTSFLGVWKPVTLGVYKNPLEQWTDVELYLDTLYKSKTYYLAFDGQTGYGHGVCIDDIKVEETGLIPLAVDTMEVSQASTAFIATGTDNNEILQYKIHIVGNSGTIALKSLRAVSLNTTNADIDPSGVKLFYTTTPVFSDQHQISVNANFVNDTVTFSNINLNLPFGYHYIWLTYDISSAALHGNSFDAKAFKNSVTIGTTTFPAEDVSPAGNRSIYETLLYDGFEIESGWTLGDGFTIGTPQAKGGWDGGNPKPAYAAKGTKVLGTNLTGGANEWDFDYPSDLTDRQYTAVSPPINCFYYNNIYLSFSRWFNIEVWDQAYIDVSTDNGATWTKAWGSDTRYFTDNDWINERIDISQFADRKSSIRIRFALGETNGDVEYSGWNIDNLALTGNFIDADVAVTQILAPISGCGHTATDSVTVRVVNYAGKPTPNRIPIGFSFDGGKTVTMDTIFGSIPVGSDTVFTFHKKANLSVGGYYYPFAKTYMETDEETNNDHLNGTKLFAVPTYSIPFVEDFEKANNLWVVTGSENTNWEWGIPKKTVIKKAGSGYYSWITKLNGVYQFNDSSYVMSPCADFAGIDFPVFDFKTISVINNKITGVQLQYSIDEGATWKLVPRLDDKWNWYDTLTSTVLQSKFGSGQGWTDSTGQWLTAKHLLPIDVRNNKKVRFRVAFASTNNDVTYDGFAFDKVQIYDAPLDLGVEKMLQPISACELTANENVVVSIKNYGLDTLEVGQKIVVGLDLDQQLYVKDTFLLTSNILPGESFNHTFSKALDLSHAGDHQVRTYTQVQGDINFFDVMNDTLIDSVSVYGMPDFDLGQDFGVKDYTGGFLIDGGQDFGVDFVSYQWDSTNVGRYRNILGPGMYYVTVTNDSACVANDSVYSYLSAQDLAVVYLYDLHDSCDQSPTYTIKASIKNMFTDNIYTTDDVYVGYTINGKAAIREKLVLSVDLAPGDSIDFSFATPVDLSKPGVYNVKVFTSFVKDFDITNDTLLLPFPIANWGKTVVSLGADTLRTKQGSSIILTATNPNVWNPYSSILWNDGTTATTFPIPTNQSSKYWVDVTDSYGCGSASDTVVVKAADITIDDILFPKDTCSASNAEAVRYILKNTSPDTLEIGTPLTITYSCNGIIKNETLNLQNRLYPDSSLYVTSGITYDLSAIQTYFFQMNVSLAFDIKPENNSSDFAFNVWGYPQVNLGADTIFTSSTDTISFDATATPTSTYLWNDGSSTYTTATYTINNRPNTSLYKVIVTDNGCSVKDSVLVWTKDLQMQAINKTIAYCELSSAEKITITMRNTGADIIEAGEKIVVGLDINKGTVDYDTIQLTSPIFGFGTRNYTFKNSYNLSAVGDYSIRAFFANTIKNVDKSNDSTRVDLKVYGYPKPDLHFDTIITSRPDTIELRVASNFTSYEWQDGYNLNVYNINSNVPGWYSVTVTLGPGCKGADSTRIISWDILPSIVEPQVEYCEGSKTQEVSILLKNNSIDILNAGNEIFVGYILDSTTIVNESFILQNAVNPNDVFTYTFNQTVDIAEVTLHDLKVWANFVNDADDSNDTIFTFPINILGIPTVSLAVDTILNANPMGIVLEPIGSFVYYTWSDAAAVANTPFAIQKNYSQVYTATVYDNNSCKNSDSVVVLTSDIVVDSIVSPSRECVFSNSENLEVWFKNIALDTLPVGTKLFITTLQNNALVVKDTVALTTKLLPDSTYKYIASQSLDFSTNDTQNVSISVVLDRDVNMSNNTLAKSIAVFEIANPGLPDLIVTTTPDTVKLYTTQMYNQYLWSEGSFNDTLYVSSNMSKKYYVTVEDANGCIATDSTQILNNDVVYDTFISPVSACELSNAEKVSFSISNQGADPIKIGTAITCYLEVDSVLIETKVLNLTEEFDYNETLVIEFSTLLDMSTKDSMLIKTYFSIPNEVLTQNDTSYAVIHAWGYPIVDLGEKYVFTNKVDTIDFVIAPGYATYTWQDNSNANTYSVTSPKSAMYSVTVANSNGCTSSDSMFVATKYSIFNTIESPYSACKLTATESLIYTITNTGADSLFMNDTLWVNVLVNSVYSFTDTIVPIDTVLPGAALEYTSIHTIDISAQGSYAIELQLSQHANDTLFFFDTIKTNIEHQGMAGVVINTGEDTLMQVPPIELSVVAGYDSYLWNDIAGTNTYTAKTSGLYVVEASSNNGCSGIDSVFILGYDLEMRDFIYPTPLLCADAITKKESGNIEFTVYNEGVDTFYLGEKIEIQYLIDEIPATMSLVLTQNLLPKTQVNLKLSNVTDFSTVADHSVKLWLKSNLDLDASNDTITIAAQTFVSPSFKLNAQGFISIEVKSPYLLKGPNDFSAYSWSNGEIKQDIEIIETATYTLTVTDGNGCTASDKLKVIVTGSSDIEQIENIGVTIYPTVVHDVLFISISEALIEDMHIGIFAENGILVQEVILIKGFSGVKSISLQNLLSGNYNVRLVTKQDVIIQKILKE